MIPVIISYFFFLFETSIHQCNDPTFVSPTHETAKNVLHYPNIQDEC